MIAEKVSRLTSSYKADGQTRAEQAQPVEAEKKEEKKEGIVAKRKTEALACEKQCAPCDTRN